MGTNYTVVRGDNLSRIAQRHSIPHWGWIYWHPRNEAFRATHDDPNLIFPGDVIYVPDPPSVTLLDPPTSPYLDPPRPAILSPAGSVAAGTPVETVVDMARQLDDELRTATDGARRRQLARDLVALSEHLESVIAVAPLDREGLPILPPLHWDSASPLAGLLVDIAPFAAIDEWRTLAANQGQPARRRQRLLRRQRQPANRLLGDNWRRPPGPLWRNRVPPGRVHTPPNARGRLSEGLADGSHGLEGGAFALEIWELVGGATAAQFYVWAPVLDAAALLLLWAAAWLKHDELVEERGRTRGYCDALGHMARAFGGDWIGHLRMNQVDSLPMIPHPPTTARFDPRWNTMSAVDWQVFSRGYATGARSAYQVVMELERQPSDDPNLYSPDLHRGKALLRSLWLQHGNYTADVLWQRFARQR